MVQADPGQLEQVILNLAVNARDAMPLGGTLSIDARDVHLDADFAAQHASVPVGDYVMLSVSDTGTGMDELTQQRMFEPFFTTKEDGKGTGLGLATVYGIVQQAGGSIWVESTLGQGTTLTIYLPRLAQDAVAKPAESPERSRRGSETILVVEDDSALRPLACRILESAGYTVACARGGGEALALFKNARKPIDLIFTDVVMPDLSGPEFVQQVADFGRPVKVLFTSGFTDDEILRRGVLNSTASFIAKPYSVRELTAKVRAVLDGGP